jgi:hypothetical protein
MMPGFMIRKELEMVTKETTVVNGMKGQERDREWHRLAHIALL